MALILKQFEIGPMQNFGYLIGDETSKQALIVDPAWSSRQILDVVENEGFKLSGLVITHAHYDHTNALGEILKQVDVPVYANPAEIDYAKSGIPIVGQLGGTAKETRGGDVVNLGETEVSFLHTPGHTPGSQCIRVGSYLITGDTLFIGGCGRSDLPGGDAATLFKSLKKISQLPSSLILCPGHDYGEVKQRTLREESRENPYLCLTDEQQFIESVSG